MEITKNKWANLAIFFAVTVLAVSVSMMLLTFKSKPDAKDSTKTDYKASLDLG